MPEVTLLDRMLIRLARVPLRLLNRRFDQSRGRVWHWRIASTKPTRTALGVLRPKAGVLTIGFAGSDNIWAIHVTREQLELVRDSAIETIRLQDEQYAAEADHG